MTRTEFYCRTPLSRVCFKGVDYNSAALLTIRKKNACIMLTRFHDYISGKQDVKSDY